MKIKKVRYGRTIEVGVFAKAESGRVWFGWEASVDPDETSEQVEDKLRALADLKEKQERADFDERSRERRALGR